MVNFDEFTAGIYEQPPEMFNEFIQGCGLAPEPTKLADRDLWCVCEIPEGETPRVKAFTQLSDFIDFIKAKENTDTFLWLFYGKPLQLSKRWTKADKTQGRFVLLSGNRWISTHTRTITEGDATGILELELTGWMGDDSTASYFQEGFKDE